VPDVTNTNPAAPVPGANSFTENQARSRLARNGFSDVGRLTKDAEGIWRGHAKKNGKEVEVAIDFQGNIVTN
jgi:putative membrane protein